MRFVLDNSVAMRWLFGDGNEDDLAYASHVLDVLGNPDAQATAPAIWPRDISRRERHHLPVRGRCGGASCGSLRADGATHAGAFTAAGGLRAQSAGVSIRPLREGNTALLERYDAFSWIRGWK